MDEMDEMDENKKQVPIALVVISVLYGFMAYATIIGPKNYLLFGYILPQPYSGIMVVVQATLFIYLTFGVYKRQELARTVLLWYNSFIMADILVTLGFVDRAKLVPEIIPDADMLGDFAIDQMVFFLTFMFILRYVKTHKQHFNNKNAFII